MESVFFLTYRDNNGNSTKKRNTLNVIEEFNVTFSMKINRTMSRISCSY